MNYFLVLSTLFLHATLFAQISYDFASPIPPNGKSVITFNPSSFGVYTNKNSPLSYEINEEGIFIVSVNINSISRQTIRESSNYTVRNNHIFGVLGNEDSIPCILDGENYYFGVKNRVQIIGGSAKNRLVEIEAGQYVLNYEENGKYVPAFISIVGNNLTINQFDYESDTKTFKKIKSFTSYSEGLEYITLNPTMEEWQKLKLDQIQGEATVFVRE